MRGTRPLPPASPAAIVLLFLLLLARLPSVVPASDRASSAPAPDAGGACDADAAHRASPEAWPGAVVVDRVPARDMTHGRFARECRARRRPVVVEGLHAASPLAEGVDERNWGWDAMRERFGDAEVEVRRAMPPRGGATDVASGREERRCNGVGLCDGGAATLRTLLDERFAPSPSSCGAPAPAARAGDGAPLPYVHDVDFRAVLPSLFAAYETSSLFAENLLLPASDGRDRWPSLFLGAAGTATGLHVDVSGTSFTMAVFRGRKQFVLFDARDGDKLCLDDPTPGSSYGVGHDPFDPDFGRCPAARGAAAHVADVRAGDLLFVPGGTHHAARNLEAGMAVSQNFLSPDDFPALMEDFGGLVVQSNRRRDGQEGQIPVDFFFLAIRDLYRVLSETDFRSDWSSDEPFWNADDAAAESYRRVLSHLSHALERRPVLATRLVFMSNPRLAAAALRAFGAWDCLEERDREFFERSPWGDAERGAATEGMIGIVDAALARSSECQEMGAGIYVRRVRQELDAALKTLHLEEGLTEHCCM